MTVESLPSRSDFDAVFSNPDAKVGRRDFLILAKVQPGHSQVQRIGFVTSKKKIKRAVDRNRFRRVFKETLRSHKLTAQIDLVVIARSRPEHLHQSAFADEISLCLQKLGQMLEKKHAES